ncbi:MAG TPA: tyrosine-type recombinase/integrase [Candidatus Limnocylindrales bacterium]|nr:tyrosine-type recombinase/integrase [Candidatus Limnocylindrales bacterium]
MQTTITKEVAEAVRAGQLVMDTQVRGFGVRGTTAGASYVVRYKYRRQPRLMVLGRVGEVTVTQARRLALGVRGDLAAGIDPLAERAAEVAREAAARAAEAAAARLLTVAEYIKVYKATAGKRKKPGSQRADENILSKHVIPKLGDVRIADLSRADVARLHASMAEIPYRANRVLALISHLCSQAEKTGYRPMGSPNPARGVDRYPEIARKRFLSPPEHAALWRVLCEMEGGKYRDSAQALKLLVLTGCRKSEIVSLAWAEVDVDGACLNLADSKTGRRMIPLAAEAAAVLAGRLSERRCAWVFPNDTSDGPRASIETAWLRARAAAKLDGVHVHDLRHSFAAAGVAAGLSLVQIGELLGHRQAQTTLRYSHVSAQVARGAADIVGARLGEIIAAADGLRMVK